MRCVALLRCCLTTVGALQLLSRAALSLSASSLIVEAGCFFFPVTEPYNQMTLQQLQDHLEACQWCWQDCLEHHSVETLHAHLTACFARFGWLCISARPETVFGGSMFMEPSCHNGLFFVSASAMRTNLVLFLFYFAYCIYTRQQPRAMSSHTCRRRAYASITLRRQSTTSTLSVCTTIYHQRRFRATRTSLRNSTTPYRKWCTSISRTMSAKRSGHAQISTRIGQWFLPFHAQHRYTLRSK